MAGIDRYEVDKLWKRSSANLLILERNWLLILDNIELNWGEMAPFLPKFPTAEKCAIIATTRQPAEMNDWAHHQISPPHFEPDDGSKFLLSVIRRTEIATDHHSTRKQAREISERVGGLPLFLILAAGYIDISQCELGDFLDAFDKSINVWEGTPGGRNWMYERTVDTMYDMALSKLSEDAKKLVNILAFLNPEGVPEQILCTDKAKAYIPALEQPKDQR
jgi:hypothetical protein